MGSAEDAEAAQREELEVLRAILGEELEDVGAREAWKVWRPLELLVRLRPSEGPSGSAARSDASVVLRLKAPPLYPFSPISVVLEDLEGIPSTQLPSLKALLEAKASEAAALEMPVVLDLCQAVQDWLFDKGKPSLDASLHEGRLRLLKQEEAAKSVQVRKAQQKEALSIQLELARRKARKDGLPSPGALSPASQDSPNFRTRSTSLPPQEAAKPTTSPSTRQRLPTISSETSRLEGAEEEDGLGAAVEDGSSRLGSEFAILQWLGQGGFGDVVKVRNRLDGNLYAIKRITLDVRSAALNRKMTREVKLLSRLNHENVVRYYNSWMETVEATEEELETTTGTGTTAGTGQPRSPPQRTESEETESSLEALAPVPGANGSGRWVGASTEWSVSYGHGRSVHPDSSSDSDDSDDEEIPTAPVRASADESDVFLRGSAGQASKPLWDSASLASPRLPTKQILYIQMEFCENHTLREYMNAGLTFGHPKEAWRLFREILEGLHYLHSQAGMIHRDVKPVNIFLDAGNHAKIGDFGLACASDRRGSAAETSALASSLEDSAGQTTDIGTALYVAPELLSAPGDQASPASQPAQRRYTAKVDVYSLGIVLFEMFYRVMELGMERVAVLRELRSAEVRLPSDLGDVVASGKHRERLELLLRSMLSHSEEERPSTEDLIRSPLVPVLHMPDMEFQDAAAKALANAQSRRYKALMERLFQDQRYPDSVQEYVFDKTLSWMNTPFDQHRARLAEELRRRVSRVFQLQGAVEVAGPMLLPKSRHLRAATQGQDAYEVMDDSGLLLSLSRDLRLGFVRWVVRQKIKRLKRYQLGLVFKRSDAPASHPEQGEEAAFDVIASGGEKAGSVASAEVLRALVAAVREAGWDPALHGRLHLRLNHSRLLRALLTHAGVKSGKPQESLLAALQASKGLFRPGKDKVAIEGVTEQSLALVAAFAALQGPVHAVFAQLRAMTNSSRKEGGGIAGVLKDARHELERVEKLSETLGLGMGVTMDVGLAERPGEYDSGLVLMLSYSVSEKRRRRRAQKLWRGEEQPLGVGGRYDGLIVATRKPHLEPEPPPEPLVGVGATLDLGTLLAALHQRKPSEERPVPEAVRLLIGSTSRDSAVLFKKLHLVQQCWEAGVSADFRHDVLLSLDALELHCQENNIPFLLLVKDSPPHLLKRWLAQEKRYQDHKVAGTGPDVVALVQSLGEEEGSGRELPKQASLATTPSEESRSLPSASSASVGNLKLEFVGVGRNGRLTGNQRRQYEGSVAAVLGGFLGKVSSRVVVTVLVTELGKEALATVAARLCLRGSPGALREAVAEAREALPNALRHPISAIEDAVLNYHHHDPPDSLLILYSLPDEFYRCLT